MFADSTKRSYRTFLHCYLTFCATFEIPALPATPVNIGRYIAYLSATKSFTSIQQYLSIVRLLHMEFGLPHPFQDNHHVSSLLKAVKRSKGCEPRYKLTLSVDNLLSMLTFLDLSRTPDAQLWSLILACFYGMLRISSVSVPSPQNWAPAKSVTRADLEFHQTGTILNMHWTKTLQYRERVLQTALPLLSSDTCPTTALLRFIALAGPVPNDAPAWAYMDPKGQLCVPTPTGIRSRLKALISLSGLSTSDFNSHSLRRSGASHLLAAQVPLETIKILGDWRSDCVYKYLKPLASQKLNIVNNSFK